MKARTSSTSVDPMYDEFEPSTELSENHEAHFLRILLPGFKREQMKITFMNFTRTLNISGERQIDSKNDIWVRFNQSYPIPQNCEEGKLQANYAHEVLTIKMPKKILSAHSPITEAQQKGPIPLKKQEPRPDREAQEEIPQKAREETPQKYAPPLVEDLKPGKGVEKLPKKYAPPHVEELKPTTQEKKSQKYLPNPVEEPRPNKAPEILESPNAEKAHENIPQGATPSKLEKQKPEKDLEDEIPYRFRIRRGKEDLIQKLEDNGRALKALGPQEPTRASRAEKGQHEEIEPTLKVAPTKPKDEKPEKRAEEIERERESKKGEFEGKLGGKPEKMSQEKEIRTRKRTEEKEKETILTKEGIVSTIGKGMRQVSASTSEVVTKISEGKWKEEEKPMLANMGAAILVIAALGVYASFKLTSYGST